MFNEHSTYHRDLTLSESNLQNITFTAIYDSLSTTLIPNYEIPTNIST